jgi:hypothetical protein
MVTRLLAVGLDARAVDVALPMGWTLPSRPSSGP